MDTSSHTSAAAASSGSSPSAWVYEASGLKKEYEGGKVQALRGVDFQIEPGSFVAITGPSGCGKSTLLQLLGALDQPSEGTLRFRGQDLAKMSDPSEYRAKDIGFIFQSFHLLPTFTALENVQLPMFETARPLRERRERAVALLESVGLGQRLDHFPSQMSGGERQRVAIARSLANDPSVLLADEPTGNLDSNNAQQVMELLVQLHAQRAMTMILITHDPSIAARAGRVLRMKDGRVESASS